MSNDSSSTNSTRNERVRAHGDTLNSRTDWTRLEAMDDSEIDLTDCPEITPAEFARGLVRKGLKPATGKTQVTLRIDSDVLRWFKDSGKGYQTRINELLRAYVEAHEPDHQRGPVQNHG
jgi:uncharacterized protein (DUF4415 family)